MRWSFGAAGRVPRLAQRRVMVFFWPTRASSANQISIGLPPTACAISAMRAGEAFKKPGWRPCPGRDGAGRAESLR